MSKYLLLLLIFLLLSCAGPVWTPADSDLLFTSNRNGNSEIYLIAAGDTAWVNLSNHPGPDNWPVWSPDGARIAFQTRRNGKLDIYVMNADGSGQTRLTDDPEHDYLPAWTPDGQRISFTSWRSEPGDTARMGHFYIMNHDGSSQQRLDIPAPGTSTGITWSPDGKFMLFSRASGTGAQVIRADSNGKNEIVLTGDDRYYGSAEFSPDSRRIACYADDGTASAIVVMDADGANARTVVAEGQNWYPRWSPDGRWLVYDPAVSGTDQGNIDIHAIGTDGSGAAVTLIGGPHRETEPSWRPRRNNK